MSCRFLIEGGDASVRAAYERIAHSRAESVQRFCERWGEGADEVRRYDVYLIDGARVRIVDWGFGGVMPYALDIARFIAHATKERSTFPFYMTDAHKRAFLDRVYERLDRKIERARYEQDIRLALLNEYVEFVEADEDENGWYLAHAERLAEELLAE